MSTMEFGYQIKIQVLLFYFKTVHQKQYKFKNKYLKAWALIRIIVVFLLKYNVI